MIARADPVGSPNYTWYRTTGTTVSTGGTKVREAAQTPFDIPTNLQAGVYYYYCVVNASSGSGIADPVVTRVVTVTVLATPQKSISVERGGLSIGSSLQTFDTKTYNYRSPSYLTLLVRNTGQFPFGVFGNCKYNTQLGIFYENETYTNNNGQVFTKNDGSGFAGFLSSPPPLADLGVGRIISVSLSTGLGLDLGDYSATVRIKLGDEILGSFDVAFSVVDKLVRFIEITHPPKLNYIEGETLDMDGLGVKLTYWPDGSEEQDPNELEDHLIFGVDNFGLYGLTITPSHETILSNLHDGVSVNVVFTQSIQASAGVLSITPTFPLVLEGGNLVSSDPAPVNGKYLVGANIQIQANVPLAGQRFTHWSATAGVTFANLTSENTTFTMPGANVTITANYINVWTIQFDVDQNGGALKGGALTATVDGNLIHSGDLVDEGKTVVFTAYPDDGYRVNIWKLDDSPLSNKTPVCLLEVLQDAAVTVKFIDAGNVHIRFFTDNKVEYGDPNYYVKWGEKAMVPIPFPERKDYYIEGWYVDDDFDGEYEGNFEEAAWNFDDPVVDDMDLFAHWLPAPDHRIVVTFIAEGGLPAMSRQFVEPDGRITAPVPFPVKENHYITGWYKDPSYISASWNFDDEVAEEMILYAKWTEKANTADVTVTFIAEGGKPAMSRQIITSGGVVTVPVPFPVRENRYVDGWYRDAVFNHESEKWELKNVWNFADPVVNDMTLYANWVEKENPVHLIVTFIAEGGIPAMSHQFVEPNGKITAPIPFPAKENYYISGWYNDPAYSSQPWDFDDEVTDHTILYAKWTKVPDNQFMITFIAEGGIPAMYSQPISKNLPVAMPDPAPTRDGHVLNGWFTEKGTHWVFSENVTGDMTLYADWVARNPATQFAVTFMAEGSIWEVQVVEKNNPLAKIPDPAPARIHQVLKGWYQDVPETHWIFSKPVTGDMTLFADWETRDPVTQVAVTFLAGNGDPGIQVKIIPVGSAVTMPDPPVRDFHVLKGWNTTGGVHWNFSDPVNNDLTLVADWIMINSGNEIAVTFIVEKSIWDVQVINKGASVAIPFPAPVRAGWVLNGWYTEEECENAWVFSTEMTQNKILYAGWDRRISGEAVVTFLANDGHPGIQIKSVELGEPVPMPDPPTRNGYVLKGWYTEPACEYLYLFDDPVNLDMTLWAGWQKVKTNEVAVTFVYNDGIINPQTVFVPKNTEVSKPADPARDGYAFTGWYTKSGLVWNFSVPVTNDMFLYAGWKERFNTETYAVTFVYNDGVNKPGTEFVLKATPVIKPLDPVRTGFAFAGWQTESGTEWNFAENVTHDMFLYAVWESNVSNTYAVTFVYNDGETGLQIVTVSENTAVSKPADPVKNDYVFTGWYDESGSVWNFNHIVDRELFLYAGWVKRESGAYAVIFVYNDDSTNPLIVFVPEKTAITKPVNPARADYVFTGWYTESGNFWNFSTPVSKDLFLYAGWREHEEGKYAVTFVFDDGVTFPQTKFVDENKAVDAPAVPARTGFTFTKWHTESGAEWNFASLVTGDMFLYADWNLETPHADKYAVTFVFNDGLTDSQTIFVEKGAPANRPENPAREGYVFTGWYDESGSVWNFTAPVNRELFLYAGWVERVPDTYAVIFVYNDGSTNPRIVFVPEKKSVTKPDDPVRNSYAFTGWYTEAGLFWNFAASVTEDLFLNAGWKLREVPGTYAVTFVYDNDLTNPQTFFVPKNTVILRPENPVKEEYVFAGWKTQFGFLWDFDVPVTGDMFLYAVWEKKCCDDKYWVTFIYNDGATLPLTVVVDENGQVGEPAAPVRTGFTFTGWYEESGATWNFTSGVTGNMFLYAGWNFVQPDIYAVTFVFMDDITLPSTLFVEKNTPISKPFDPTRSDYAFTGWHTESGAFWDFNEPVSRDMFLYAGWKERRPAGTFAATFVFEDGLTLPRTVFVPENTPLIKPINPVRDGYAFTGWYTESGLFWNFATPLTKDIFLYAGWEKRLNINTYSVTFVYHDGINRPYTEFVTKDAPVIRPANPVRTGFTFAGWYTETGSKWDFMDSVLEDMFLYAGWESNYPGTYSVTFVYHDETNDPQTEFVPKNTPVSKPDDPLRTDYVFTGWYTESDVLWNFDNPVVKETFLYAGWKEREPNAYAVIFVYNDGLTDPQIVFVPENTAVTKPADPVKAGYAFTGWNSEFDISWDFDIPVTSDIFLYAKWMETPSLNMFSVTFEYKDGITPSVTVFVPVNTPVSRMKNDPVREGFTFTGWFADSKLVTEWNFNNPVTGNMFLYAGWDSSVDGTWFVTFVRNDGTLGFHTEFVQKNTPVDKPANPIRDGYAFSGWYNESGSVWNFDDPVTRNIFLYAMWKKRPILNYAVTFDYNDYVKNPKIVFVTENTRVNRPEPDPEREEHIFAGWLTEDNKLWDFNTPVTQDMSLIAKWIPDPHIENSVIVFFIAADGDPDFTYQAITRGETVSVPAPLPVRAGYFIEGWYENGNFTSAKWNFNNLVTADITTLVAKWEEENPVTYEVRFDYNNGGITEPLIVYVKGDNLTIVDRPEIEPVWADHIFAGWYTVDDMLWNFFDPVSQNMYLIAKWISQPVIIDPYVVIFVYNNGVNPPEIQLADNNGKISRPADPVRDNYDFAGWFTEDNKQWDFNTSLTNNMILVAKWILQHKDFYAVTFVYNDGVTNPKTEYVSNNNRTPVARPDDPSRANFVFTGWFNESEELWDFGKPISGNMLLIAKWLPKGSDDVVVTFMVNDNGQSVIRQVFKKGQMATDPAPVRQGYEFEGWYKNANFSGAKWNFSDPVPEDMTLFARWYPIYTITFNVADGVGGLTAMIDGVNIVSGASVRAGSTVFFMAAPDHGYEIQTWTDNGATVNGKDEVYFIQNLSGNRNVQVFFERSQVATYTVTVVSDGDGATGSGIFFAGEIVEIRAGTKPDGKNFVNWTADSKDVSFKNDETLNTTFVMPACNVKVTANFTGILDFEKYVAIKWNNTLMLNIQALRKRPEGSIVYNIESDVCKWYENGEELPYEGATYSAGDGRTLKPDAIYMFEIRTSGGTYFSTPYEHKVQSAIAFAYPNPVRSGDMITIEGVEEGGRIQIFSQVGALVSQFIATGETTTLTLNVSPGMYVIRTSNGDVKVVIE